MPNTARKLDLGSIPLSPAGAPAAQGGPVAALQRSIQDRMAAGDLLPMPAPSPFDRTAEMVSRLAGVAALGLGYSAVAIWWLG